MVTYKIAVDTSEDKTEPVQQHTRQSCDELVKTWSIATAFLS